MGGIDQTACTSAEAPGGAVPPSGKQVGWPLSLQPHQSDARVETVQSLRCRDTLLTGLGSHGDRRALDQLFARYARVGYRKGLEILGNPEDAEDAVQEGPFSAFRNLRRFEGRSQFSTWVIRIVINAALMSLRRRRVHLSLPAAFVVGKDALSLAQILPDRRPTPEEAIARQERRDTLANAIRKLPERSKDVLHYHLDGFSVSEIAEIMGVSLGTVKSLLHRARLKVLRNGDS